MNSEFLSSSLDKLIPNPICELVYNKNYELVLAVMLSAQTTDKRVNEITNSLFSKYKSLEELNRLSINEIENEIKSIGLYKTKAKNFKDIVEKLIEYGSVPNNRQELEKMSGIGRKSASVILSELFDIPAFAVDTHVMRVSKRLLLAKENDNAYDIEKKLCKFIKKDKWNRIHKQLVLFGRYRCKSYLPLCEDCPFKNNCKKKK